MALFWEESLCLKLDLDTATFINGLNDVSQRAYVKGSSSVWQCVLIPWQYWGSTRTQSPVILKLWGADITAVSVIPVSCAALHLSSTSPLLFTFLCISPFPRAWLSIPLAGTEKNNFVDHYCAIIVISVNSFSTHASRWKDAQRAACSTASVTPAGRPLLTQVRVHAQVHTYTSYSTAPLLVSFQPLSLRASSSFLK